MTVLHGVASAGYLIRQVPSTLKVQLTQPKIGHMETTAHPGEANAQGLRKLDKSSSGCGDKGDGPAFLVAEHTQRPKTLPCSSERTSCLIYL